MNLKAKAILSAVFGLFGTVLAAGENAMTPEQAESLDALRSVAETDGIVRVIVSLAAPEDIAGMGANATMESVKTMMQTMLPLTEAPLVDPIADQPLVVMEVTATGLDFLSTAPMVARIEADGLTGIPPFETTPVDGATDDSPSFGGNGSGSSDLSAPQSD